MPRKAGRKEEEEEEFLVEDILEFRLQNGKRQFWIKWEGYEERTWEGEANITEPKPEFRQKMAEAEKRWKDSSGGRANNKRQVAGVASSEPSSKNKERRRGEQKEPMVDTDEVTNTTNKKRDVRHIDGSSRVGGGSLSSCEGSSSSTPAAIPAGGRLWSLAEQGEDSPIVARTVNDELATTTSSPVGGDTTAAGSTSQWWKDEGADVTVSTIRRVDEGDLLVLLRPAGRPETSRKQSATNTTATNNQAEWARLSEVRNLLHQPLIDFLIARLRFE
eukprot:GHVS01091174.1.p1 GENE.GHVS01091174.1~~GHVS01091174.1.p1  ORF type:complete len:275 (+),score=65.69 GHVS01091174.1:218-1042(+)